MNFTGIEETPGNGYVTGFNRPPVAGEIDGDAPKHLRVYGLDIEAYTFADGVLTPKTEAEVEALELARSNALADLEARVAELEAEQESAGVRNKTPQEVKDWIDAQFDGAATNAELKEVLRNILKKIAVYLLRV